MGNHEIMYLIFSYVIGSIPTGFVIFWHSKKDDIRKEGSGNIGATNILRTCGGKAAIATLFIDVLKGAIPVIYGLIHFKYPPLILGAGTLAIIGHIFPVWLKFQGGKGVATFAGVSAAYMAAPDGILVFPVFAFFFIGTMIYSGFVSASSIAAVTGAFFAILFTNIAEASLLVLLVGILIIIKHNENIKRILEGVEEKFYRRKNG